MSSSRNLGDRLNRLLARLWKQASEPVFWLGRDLTVVWVNRAWEDLTGFAAEEAMGLRCLARGPGRGGDLAGLGGSLYPPPESLAGRPAGGRTLIVHAGGERRWRRIDFWPFHDRAGELIGLLGRVSPDEPTASGPEPKAQRLRAELLEVREQLLRRHGFDQLIGRGPAHLRLLDQVEAASATAVPVLILGEAGTGKRLVARTIHQQSSRAQAPLLAFDTAALPAEILRRQLLGDPDAPALNLPDGATLLLGDILDLPRDLQAELASRLDRRVRLLGTSRGDPEAALRAERLRPDLFYALSTLTIRLSPLRERLDDLPLLLQHLLERANARGGRQRSAFHESAQAMLLGYDWPGNIRELARVVDDAHQRGGGDLIATEDLPATIRGQRAAAYHPPPLPTSGTPLDELLTQVERRFIESALQRARQNKSRAAELLGISRPRLYRRIKDLGLPDVPDVGDDLPSPHEDRNGSPR